jgi:hypothetical protein
LSFVPVECAEEVGDVVTALLKHMRNDTDSFRGEI